MALLLGATVVTFAIGIANLRTSERLAAEGQVTRAQVVGKHVDRHRRRLDRFLDIQYRTAAGQVISGTDDVAPALFDRVAVGDSVEVRYLPAEPDVHALGSAPRRDTSMLWLAGVCLVLTVVYRSFGA